jgi:hypothetical protein
VIALDLSKAFDSIRHSTLLDKIAQLPIPDNVYNWLVDFFQNRSHCTKMRGHISGMEFINASVVQGSAVGPAAFSIASSDLHPVVKGNEMRKYADDGYIIVPASNCSTSQTEVDNVTNWAGRNNLKINSNKSLEMIFRRPRSKILEDSIPTLVHIKRVQEMKILGFTVTNDLKVQAHVKQTLSSCFQSLYALRILKSHGLNGAALQQVYHAITLSKLLYGVSAWWGFASSEEILRIEAFLRKSKKCFFCSNTIDSVSSLVDVADRRLFHQICSNPDHVLHSLLPPLNKHQYSLRHRNHNRMMPKIVTNDLYLHKIFITRMLLSDSY